MSSRKSVVIKCCSPKAPFAVWLFGSRRLHPCLPFCTLVVAMSIAVGEGKADEPAVDRLKLKSGTSRDVVVESFTPPTFRMRPINADGSSGPSTDVRFELVESLEFHDQLAVSIADQISEFENAKAAMEPEPPPMPVATPPVIDCVDKARDAMEAWKYPDVVRVGDQATIAKVVAIVNGLALFEVPSGKAYEVPMDFVNVLKMASTEELANSLTAAVAAESSRKEGSNKKKTLVLPPECRLVFSKAGKGAIDSRSPEFDLPKFCLMIVGTAREKPEGMSVLSLATKASGDGYRGDVLQILLSDKQVDIRAKACREDAPGPAIAEVNGRADIWFVFVVELPRYPDADLTDAVCRSVLDLFGIDPDFPVTK